MKSWSPINFNYFKKQPDPRDDDILPPIKMDFYKRSFFLRSRNIFMRHCRLGEVEWNHFRSLYGLGLNHYETCTEQLTQCQSCSQQMCIHEAFYCMKCEKPCCSYNCRNVATLTVKDRHCQIYELHICRICKNSLKKNRFFPTFGANFIIDNP